MNEELNQVQNENQEELVIKDDDGLFDDYQVEQETTEATEVSEEQTPTEVVETPFGLNIKYNGEEQTLNEEQAREYAQKGMNYDRIYEPLERLARMNGMSVGDYLNRLNDTQIQYEISQEIENLRNDPKYEGVRDDILEEIASNRVHENVGNRDEQFAQQQKGIADAEKEKVQRDINKFMEEYPEFKNKGPEVLDPKVFDYVKQGYTLLEAYNKWSKEQMDANKPKELAKEKVSRLNEENKRKSLGNTTNAGSTEVDDFLNGFLNG